MRVRVLRGGAFTTVQDLGRPGFGACGVPPGGAMDPFAARAANRLAGNPDGAALLEATLSGPTLVFDGAGLAALTGGPFEAERDGHPAPWNATFPVRAGTTLAIGRALGGARAWLAVSGGFDVPVVLNARATSRAGAFGGFEGRALREGDLLETRAPRAAAGPRRFRDDVPASSPRVLRVLPGAQADAFPAATREAFLVASWTVDPRSDRAGVRLAGPRLDGPGESLPEGVVTGGVQVPPGGHPIVLGPDRPVTGGYPKIAQVIEADTPLLAALRPGDAVRFAAVSLADALAALAARHAALDAAIEDA